MIIIIKIKESKMRNLLIATVLMAFTFTLTACGDPKPAQYPPSLYKDHENLLSDEELAKVQKETAEAVEDAADDAEEAIEDAAEKVEEATDSY
jgi:predicted small lipoprotein YifL